MAEIVDMDFSRIAAELRRDSEAAARAAAHNPGESERLIRMARDLARAAERIAQDAEAREGHLVIDDPIDDVA